MRIPSNEIQKANQAIVKAIDNSAILSRGSIAQNVLNNMRNLAEHILVYSIFGDALPYSKYYDAIEEALKRAKRDATLRFIYDFHFNLQKVVSHYTPSESSSERLLLSYMENLFLLRQYADEKLGLSILHNLEQFPINRDKNLEAYYAQIAKVLDSLRMQPPNSLSGDRYYTNSVKPIVVGMRIVYELSLSNALDARSKTDRVIAFSNERIPTNNSVRLGMVSRSIKICGRAVPIVIIVGWLPSIRPCEINNLLKIVGCKPGARGDLKSYRSLMRLLRNTGMNLCELCDLPDDEFAQYRGQIEESGGNTSIETLLDRCHEVLRDGGAGTNILKFLLFRPRNDVIKNQLQPYENNWLGNLCLRNECIPFDGNPFSTNLYKSKTGGLGAIRCIEPEGREADLLACRVISICEQERGIYLEEGFFEGCPNLDQLIEEYNASLYYKHAGRRLAHERGQVFIRGYEDDISTILTKLLGLSAVGVEGYSDSVASWLAANPGRVDDPAKETILQTLFEETRVSFVCGSAGTGKTTLVNYVCELMQGARMMAIANTNPAVEGLRRRVKNPGCEFLTVAKYLSNIRECDLLIVDECSTVSNASMRKILEYGKFQAILLVGDIRQIEAIDFGNWFDLSMAFMPKKCVQELSTPWRATSDALRDLWGSVRALKPDIVEIMEANEMSHDIDDSLFKPIRDDEVVLCLNYDGIYGINNVNLILQAQNPNPVSKWGVHHYKVGDPVLFNDSNRFYPLLYNNLKGRIVAISKEPSGESISFDIAVNEPINALTVSSYAGLKYVGMHGGEAVVRFSVCSMRDSDEEGTLDNIVPFQVAYAVSIHKAQGLEYDSVKVIVTEDVEKMVSHNVFYTAITRARECLRVYWTPETQAHVIKSLAIADNNKDACLLSNKFGYRMYR